MARAVAEEHQHGQQPLGLLCVVVQALQEDLQAPLGAQLTDEGPELGQEVVQVGEAWKGTNSQTRRGSRRFSATFASLDNPMEHT